MSRVATITFHASIALVTPKDLLVTVLAEPTNSKENSWTFMGPWEDLRGRLGFFAIQGTELPEIDKAVRAKRGTIRFELLATTTQLSAVGFVRMKDFDSE